MVAVEIMISSHLKYVIPVFAILLIIHTSIQKETEMIYILLWTYTLNEGWIYRDLQTGQEAFVSRNCSFQNCFITPNRSYFNSVLRFDVLLFNSVHLARDYYDHELPLSRIENQLYIAFGVEPAMYNPIPAIFNGVFNSTWTYKLTSDIVYPYFIVKNNLGKIIGPKTKINWLNIRDLAPTNHTIKQKLRSKCIAAAWVASNCESKSRLNFIVGLSEELSKYGHRIDIYGACGNLTCKPIATERKGLLTSCYSKIESDYYFYMAFENSVTEDYVTEKVLHGLHHFAVPVVFGGAEYTRFLPDGIYLNAYKLGITSLAKEMNDIINNPPRYYDFFKWHGYYSFHDTADNNYTESVCAFCAFLNNKARGFKSTIYANIKYWWRNPYENDININVEGVRNGGVGIFGNG